MFNQDFDPYQALQDLKHNQEVLHTNDRSLAQAINDLMTRCEQQQRIIDGLVQQVQSTSKANEILLESFLKEINKSLKDLKWPNQ